MAHWPALVVIHYTRMFTCQVVLHQMGNIMHIVPLWQVSALLITTFSFTCLESLIIPHLIPLPCKFFFSSIVHAHVCLFIARPSSWSDHNPAHPFIFHQQIDDPLLHSSLSSNDAISKGTKLVSFESLIPSVPGLCVDSSNPFLSESQCQVSFDYDCTFYLQIFSTPTDLSSIVTGSSSIGLSMASELGDGGGSSTSPMDVTSNKISVYNQDLPLSVCFFPVVLAHLNTIPGRLLKRR